jgi:hypothetical protein
VGSVKLPARTACLSLAQKLFPSPSKVPGKNPSFLPHPARVQVLFTVSPPMSYPPYQLCSALSYLRCSHFCVSQLFKTYEDPNFRSADLKTTPSSIRWTCEPS